MENKYKTLFEIYEMVKNDANPTSSVIHPSEIILRQYFPWDEIVKYLDELKSDNYINILNHSPAVIFITQKGIQYFQTAGASTGNFMHAA